MSCIGVPGVQFLCQKTTLTSRRGINASTSSPKCMVTCPCCTLSSGRTQCCLKPEYHRTSKSASNSYKDDLNERQIWYKIS